MAGRRPLAAFLVATACVCGLWTLRTAFVAPTEPAQAALRGKAAPQQATQEVMNMAAASAVLATPEVAHAKLPDAFWVISISMVAATVFFLMESMSVGSHWKTSMNVGALVTLVAAVHYFYMREFWVINGTSPILYRYIDWSITVPLQMIEFYLILAAVKPNLSAGMFWRLLIGTIVMLAAGYAGEAHFVNAWAGFIVGMAGWGFILFEIFGGEAGKTAGEDEGVNQYVKASFNTMRLIVSVGWSIYPLGYFFGYLMGGVDDSILNMIYNLADLVNKIGFCLAIWSSAKASTLDKENSLLH